VRPASLEDIGAALVTEIGDVDVDILLNNVAKKIESFSSFYDFVDAAVVHWYLNLFLQPELVNVIAFLHEVFDACQIDACTVVVLQEILTLWASV
jgi:hypothetical protein